MNSHYLSLAKQGNNEWWRYLVSVVLIIFFYQIIGAIPLAILMIGVMTDGNSATSINLETVQFEGVDPILLYLVINFLIISILAGLYISIRFLHHRKFITLITPHPKIKWKRILEAFTLYFFLLCVIVLLNFLLSPQEYQLTFKPLQFFIFLPIALVVTPIQASVEELLFRGYLMQGISLKTRNIFIPIMLSSFIFVLPHLANPEVKSGFFLATFFYLILGIFLAVITVKDNSLELAMGVHTANNLFVVLILNSAHSALPSPSIFTASYADLLNSVINFMVAGTIFYLVIFRKQLSQPAVKG